MENININYKLDRNKEIFEDYLISKSSYNQLAKKYNLTPQRVQAIIKDHQKKGLNEKLSLKATKKQREDLKNKAVEFREQGNLDLALELFNQVIEWDKANSNDRGYVDVLGHIRIVYTLMADNAKDNKSKMYFKDKALEISEQAVKYAENKNLGKNSVAIMQIHYVTSVFQKLRESKVYDKKEVERGLKMIDEAIKNLEGSMAHKAWPAGIKARILNEIGKPDEAFDTLLLAEKWLYEGYEDEIRNNDQAEMKLYIWRSGIDNAKAEILLKTKKNILMKYSLESIIGQSDPEGYLTHRKREAREKLKKI